MPKAGASSNAAPCMKDVIEKENKCFIVINFSSCTYNSSEKTSTEKCWQTSTTTRFTSKKNVSSSADEHFTFFD